MLAADLKFEADWELANLLDGPDFFISVSIRGEYRPLHEACSVVSSLVPSSGVDLLVMRGVKSVRRALIPRVGIGASESIVSADNTHIRRLESPFTSKHFEFDAAAAELDSTAHCYCLDEEVAVLVL